MSRVHRRTLSPDPPWTLRALIALLGTVLFASTLVELSLPDEAAAGPSDLLLVTSDGLLTGRDADLDTLFQTFGWTVTAIDDDAAPSALIAAAESSGVVYIAAGSNTAVADELAVTRAPVVSEDVSGWASLMDPFGTPGPIPGSAGPYTDLDVLDDTHPITSPLGTGLETVFSSGQTWTSWDAAVGTGMQTLAARSDDSSARLLVTAESGVDLISGSAEHRRVFFAVESAPVSSWNATLEDMVERSLDWAAGGTAASAPPVTPIGDLVMVTGTGGFGGNTDALKRNLFESFGWTVTALGEAATAAQVTAAATANDVMFASDTLGSFEAYDLRDEAIGIVNEHFSGWSGYLNAAAQEQSFTTAATVDVVDTSHPITRRSTPGSLTIHSSSDDVTYWDSGVDPLPAGVDVLVEASTSSDHDALLVAETGAALYTSYTAADRRVWFPSDSTDPSLWTADYETLMQRSLLWAASMSIDADSDGDGLWDHEEDANTDADDDPSTSPGPNTDGDANPNYLDADDDGDGTPTASENADPNGDGDPRDALDGDRDGQPDYLDAPVGPSSSHVGSLQKVSSTVGGLVGPLDDGDAMGESVAAIGDVDGDGVVDLAVSAARDDDGGADRGAIYVLFMNPDGSVRAEQKISSTVGGLIGPLDDGDLFGSSLAGLGDVDGDGVVDLAVGAVLDDDGGTESGAVYVLFLETDGTVRAEQKISDTTGGLTASVTADRFGISVAGVGDVDGDGVVDLAVGAFLDDAGGTNRGAVYVLLLQADGSVRAEQKISDVDGGLSGVLDDEDRFGISVAGVGDVDGDGVVDLAVGASRDDDGGVDRGAIYLLFMNSDGSVGAEQKISELDGGLSGVLDDDGRFGSSVAGVGDVDGDGVVDLLVGAALGDDGGPNRGAVYVLLLQADGSVRAEQKISNNVGGLPAALNDDDRFGSSLASLGDLDGDEQLNIAVGARHDDDGGTDRGAAYVLELAIDSDGDGLWDHEEDANTDADDDPSTSPGPNTDGDANPNYLDADDDGDGTPTASENADPNEDGDPRDAFDSDRDGQPDYLDAPTDRTDVLVTNEQKISSLVGGLAGPLNVDDKFGTSVAAIGDVDGDGVVDLAVGAPRDDDGTGDDSGALYVLFMNTDGTVRAEQKISDTEGGFTGSLSNFDELGHSVAGIGDLDGDGIPDIAVGAWKTDATAQDLGSVYVVFLNADGTVKALQTLNDSSGNVVSVFDDEDRFSTVTGIGDVDGDGLPDIAVGAQGDDDGTGDDLGAVYVLFMNADGTVDTTQKISEVEGGFISSLDDSDEFGQSVSGIGDLDGDGVPDMAVGAWLDDDGGADHGAVYVLFLNTNGTVKAQQKISETEGSLPTVSDGADQFGFSVSGIGDVDLDGLPDLAVGSWDADDGGNDQGGVNVLFMNSDGTVKGAATISALSGGFTGPLDPGDRFATVSGLGDLDGDGAIDLAIGAMDDDDGGDNRGAVYVLALTPLADSDGDGLWDHEEDANTDADDDPSTSPGPNTDGDANPNYLDADDDGDGTPTASENADPNGDGDPRDALDSDRDGQPDYLDGPTIGSSGRAVNEQKISELEGGFSGFLDVSDDFGSDVVAIGDLDGDGVVDLAAGARRDDDGGTNRGAVYVLFMNTDGTVRTSQKISDTAGGFGTTLGNADWFGAAVAGVGDVDGDGIVDVAVGAMYDDDGGTNRGAVYVLFLNTDGTVRAEQKISDTEGGFETPLEDNDVVGESLAGIGDLDGDGVGDLVVGTLRDDDGGTHRGAVYVLFLNTDGTVRAEQKISDTEGGFEAILQNGDAFGSSVSGLGDLDGDGVIDLAVSAREDDDGSSDRGAVYVLFMNGDGTVRDEQKISDVAGGFNTPLSNIDYFGSSVSGVGDVDDDGVFDLVVGARNDDDGSANAGAVYVLFLNTDGTVKAEQKISNTAGGFGVTLDGGDIFGASLTGVGDLDGDGSIDLAVGARADDDGATDSGALYVLSLAPKLFIVNSTGDASDLSAGDGVCDTGSTNSEGADECTLRAAIQEANALTGDDAIHFDIPVSDGGHLAGVWTITPATALPTISTTVEIDASTHPSWLTTPVVVLDGTSVPTADGLDITGSDVTVRGLAVGRFFRGIRTSGDRTLIDQNHLGTNAAGDYSARNSQQGLMVSGPDSLITNNVISGNGLDGISVDDAGDGARIFSNHIGINAAGTFQEPNGQEGIELNAASDVVIGAPGAGNVISGNDYAGINAWFTASTNVVVQSNLIGVAADGSTPIPNSGGVDEGGITIRSASSDWLIGGNGAGEGNTIAFNNGDGIEFWDSGATDIAIIGNNVHGNTGLGIDHVGGSQNAAGVTANDAGDADSGANDLLNHPVITSIGGSPTIVSVEFELDVPAGDYRVEAFRNGSGSDPSGYGEGENYRASTTITHTGSGVESFTFAYADTNRQRIALTATEEITPSVFGSTSEFSAIASFTLVVNSTGDSSDLTPGDGSCDTGAANAAAEDECTLRAAIEEANAAGPSIIEFDIPTADGGHSGGIWTLTPASAFDDIATSVVIDGSTQPGWASTPVIQLDGTSAGTADGLRFLAGADDSEVRSLAIGLFDGSALVVESDRTLVAGNHVGIDAAGLVAAFTSDAAIWIDGGADNVVGGLTAADRNLIASTNHAILISGGALDTVVSGNHIGAEANGDPLTGVSGGGDGIHIRQSSLRTTIGGPTTSHGNLIAAAAKDGIVVSGESTDGATIQNNVVGFASDITGAGLVPRNGILITAGADDIDIVDNIVGNTSDGIAISGATTNSTVHGNTIGTNGGLLAANHEVSSAGIRVSGGATGVAIGGPGAGEGNHLAAGTDSSASIVVSTSSTDDVSVLGNTIVNDHGAIDLGDDGPTANDSADADSGANDLLNYPTIIVTQITGSGPYTVDLDVTLDAPAGDYRIEVYANTLQGYGGVGKAEQLVHAFDLTHTGSGPELFATAYSDTSFHLLSATATENLGSSTFGSTSEMSPPNLPTSAVFVVNSTRDAADSSLSDNQCLTGSTNVDGDPECTFRAALSQANRLSAATIEFAIPESEAGFDTDGFWNIVHPSGLPSLFADGLTIDGSTQPGFDGSRPLIALRDDGTGEDLLDIVASDISVSHLSLLEPGDDGVQLRSDRTTLTGVWVGVDPAGLVVESPTAFREGLIIYDGTTGLLIEDSRVAGFDTGVVVNSGTVDVSITTTEIFDNRNGGVAFGYSGDVTLLGNSIHDNEGLGIDLGPINGIPLPNDAGDGDSGANDLLNHPVLAAATAGVGTLDVDYAIDVPAGDYRIEFFGSDRPDPTGFGEGQTLLGTDTITHAGGNVAYSHTVAEASVVTATATPDAGGGAYGGTSEFSNALLVDIVFVNSTGDTTDLTPGDGICDTGATNAEGFAECTLRAAIEEANANVDADLIHFQIPETDTGFTAGAPDFWTIAPSSALPVLTDVLTIDGSSQPGWTDGPVIQLDGTSVTPAGSDGLEAAEGMTISDLSITSWVDDGVAVGQDNVRITGNWFGVAPDGVPSGNDSSDLVIYGTADGTHVGGPDPLDGNVFAAGGSNGAARFLDDATNSLVQNNFFGVASDGVTPLGAPGGLLVLGDNTSGTDVFDNQFGDTGSAALLVTADATGSVVQGNIFGTDPTGTAVLSVGQAIVINTSGSVLFGGIDPTEWNTSRNVLYNAVSVSATQTGVVTYLGNSTEGSGILGIDLANDGVTVNDPNDADAGPNGLLNFPDVVSATAVTGAVDIIFDLDVPAGTYRIEAFDNPTSVDWRGFGEGEDFVGSTTVVSSGSGAQRFEMTAIGEVGAELTFTATEDLGAGSFGATSEFSAIVTPTGETTQLDLSVRRTDLIERGGPALGTAPAGIAGDGYDFNGTLQRLIGPPTDITSAALTMSAWVRLDTTGALSRVISKDGAYELAINGITGEATATLGLEGLTVNLSGGSVPVGSWHHLAATWSGGLFTLYVDGAAVDSGSASGTLVVDLNEPLIIGNAADGSGGLDGTIDQVEVQHRSMPAAEVLARFRSGSTPSAFITLGAEQSAAPDPWTTSNLQSHSGGSALSAPTTLPGADAWITAIGIDEPGVELSAWWWISDPTANEVAIGSRTGPSATDQFDASASGTGLDLGVIDGATYTSSDTDGTTLTGGTWQQVVLTTDELGVASFQLDGINRLGPTTLTGDSSGSIGFRAADIDPLQQWFIDDVRLRRLVSDEPTTTLAGIDRN